MPEVSKKVGGIEDILVKRGLDCGGDELLERIESVSSGDVERALRSVDGLYSFEKLLALISPAAEDYLEKMAQMSRRLTVQRFGRTIRLYAPLYLSSFCNNSCLYCGFNENNEFKRKRLSVEEAEKEAEILALQGFRDILLVSSEDTKHIDVDYLVALAGKLRDKFSSISIEIHQLSSEEYARFFEAGIDGVSLYQETYDRGKYAYYHPKGPKADYRRRLRSGDSIGQVGMREIGLGALLGLADWRLETLALAEHGHYLMKKYWRSHISFSFPRIRPACKVERSKFEHLISDKELVQMMVALRLCFADVGLVMSTRENAKLRDHLISIGVTRISAGSKTNPGGYSSKSNAGEQFHIDDNRSAEQFSKVIMEHGFEAVWKDWDSGFCGD
ncbi:MAG: 2-iminoacetate synthase ThiH [Phycisphaerae bacterium]|nr:2-iminoacetate synthase ThiH [Phycisphaerae bacterium]